ncbi:MAG: hypothetical protein VKI81_00485 [Synechococcaceae cyanobacterium]|nr:hypothetical protein [Synechococcaceae cyanobacterium]
MTSFGTFTVLYMGAFLLHLSEEWDQPLVTLGFFALSLWIAFSRPSIARFAIFLLASSLFYLALLFPDLANHSNVILSTNLCLLIGILVMGRGRSAAELCTGTLFPTIRLLLVVVYAMAGFHKLNHDFFDPTVSCISDFLGRGRRELTATVLRVPGLVVTAAGLTALALLGRRLRTARPLSGAWRLALPALLFLAALALLLLALAAPVLLPASVAGAVVVALAAVIALWELGGGLLLLFPRTQGWMLAAAWIAHGSLALIGFVDFGSLALAMLFVFLPPAYARVVADRTVALPDGRRITAVRAYLLMVAGIACLTALHHRLGISLGSIRLLSGILFNGAVLFLLWPLLEALRRPDRAPWRGVPLLAPDSPPLVGLCGAGLLAFGMTSYLGLRTAGNFSMFSNLRTEGSRSNHLLLGSNPIKLWGYQEDVVQVLQAGTKGSALDRRLSGYALPVVELRKWIHDWTADGHAVPITFVYRGRIHTSADITRDPAWRTRGIDGEMAWMDFRPIQAAGPNRCRW